MPGERQWAVLLAACLAAGAPAVQARAADPLLDAMLSSDLAQHLGSDVVVCGVVVAVRQKPGRPQEDLEFDLGQQAGKPDLTVHISKKDRGRFSPVFDRYIDRRQLCVEGTPVVQDGALPVFELRGADTGFRFMGALPPPPNGFAAGVLDYYHVADTPGVIGPKLLHMVNPKYTAGGIQAGVTGNVEIAAVVDADGRVSNLWPTVSLDPFLGMDDAAIGAARLWTFSPGTIDGQATSMKVYLVATFDLHAPQPSALVPAAFRPTPAVVPARFARLKYPVPLQLGHSTVVPAGGSRFATDDPFGNGATPLNGAGVSRPITRTAVAPHYPLDALKQNIQGTVLVDAIVAADGRVVRTRVRQSFQGCLPGLEAEAQRSVQSWSFWPGQVNGTPAAIWLEVSVAFQLRR